MTDNGIGSQHGVEQGHGVQRTWIALGAFSGLTAVAMAALAAHALNGLEPAALAAIRSAVEIHGWHALALLGVGLWAPHGGRLADAAGCGFAAGTLLFCGTVYATAL